MPVSFISNSISEIREAGLGWSVGFSTYFWRLQTASTSVLPPFVRRLSLTSQLNLNSCSSTANLLPSQPPPPWLMATPFDQLLGPPPWKGSLTFLSYLTSFRKVQLFLPLKCIQNLISARPSLLPPWPKLPSHAQIRTVASYTVSLLLALPS